MTNTTAQLRCQSSTVSEIDESAFAVLREVEIPWLSNELSRAIANLGYPVGMGLPPSPEHCERAAAALFERYAKMIEMARTARFAQTPARQPTEAMLNAAREWSRKKYGTPIGNDAATGCWQAMLAAVSDTSTLCQCQPLTRYADAPHDDGCPLSRPVGNSE